MTGLREHHKAATRRALEDAALRLFARDGYEATSIEAIAAEASVSSRTFFRYYATKDEVLTPDREERQALLVAAVASAVVDARTTAPLEIAAAAFIAIAPSFEAEREVMLLRRRAAVTSPALRGRLYDVVHTWQRTLADALAEVDDDAETALAGEVAAQVAIAIWQGAITRWLADDEATLEEHLTSAFAALRR